MAVDVWQTNSKSYYRQKKYSSNTQITVSSESCSDENREVEGREDDSERETSAMWPFFPNIDRSPNIRSPI